MFLIHNAKPSQTYQLFWRDDRTAEIFSLLLHHFKVLPKLFPETGVASIFHAKDPF